MHAYSFDGTLLENEGLITTISTRFASFGGNPLETEGSITTISTRFASFGGNLLETEESITTIWTGFTFSGGNPLHGPNYSVLTRKHVKWPYRRMKARKPSPCTDNYILL